MNKAETLKEMFKGTNLERDGIVNERCSCGHLRSDHEDFFELGHGRCTLCQCEQFTWVGWVKDGES